MAILLAAADTSGKFKSNHSGIETEITLAQMELEGGLNRITVGLKLIIN